MTTGAFLYDHRLSVLASCCLRCLIGTEQQLMPTLNVVFWNQVIQTNQFSFLALRASISRFSGGYVLFVV
jgi:hypothetical protein